MLLFPTLALLLPPRAELWSTARGQTQAGVMTDSEPLAKLLARTALKDRAAFQELFRATQGLVYGVCFKMLRDNEVTEEVVQDAYVKVWTRASDYNHERGSPTTWIVAIARNRCLDVLRRRGVDDAPWEDHYAETIADEADSPEKQAVDAGEARAVRQCLETLDAAQRAAVEIAFVEGLAHPEVAARLGRPLGTVKSQIRRGLLKLKTCLGDELALR